MNRIVNGIGESIQRAPLAPRYYWQRVRKIWKSDDDRIQAVRTRTGSLGKPLEEERQQLDLPHLVREARSRLRAPVPLCKVCDLPEYNDPDWLSAASALGLPTDGTYITKKYWEYAHLLYGLRRLNCIRPNARALSVGCGSEPHLYYLTNHIAEVVGIDLFEGDSTDVLEHPEKYAMMPYQPERLKLLRMNGRKLEFPDNSFDIVFSLSSIEHFGGHGASAEAMREIARVLKPGGVAAIATELIMADAKHPKYFRWSDLLKYVVRPSKLRLVEDVDLSMTDSLKEQFIHVRDIKSPLYLLIHYGEPPHLVPFTSVMLFMIKSESRPHSNHRTMSKVGTWKRMLHLLRIGSDLV